MKPSPNDGAALAVSLGLHALLLLTPLLAPALFRAAAPPPLRTESVALFGSSIEIEAPTPELFGAQLAAPNKRAPAPVDVSTLPLAAEPATPARQPQPRATPKPQPAPAADAAPAPEVAPPPIKPRAPHRKPRPAASAASASEGAAASAERPGEPTPGSFGQEGLPPGVRRLGYAFTRAIPAATPGDSAWRELPVGHVGTIRIELEVDAHNRLGALERWHARAGEPEPPAALERMVEHTLLLLRAGQFALSGSNQAGRERLVIDVTLRDDAPDPDGADVVVQKRFEGATPGHPGKAYFRYGTGRAFEAKVTIASSGR